MQNKDKKSMVGNRISCAHPPDSQATDLARSLVQKYGLLIASLVCALFFCVNHMCTQVVTHNTCAVTLMQQLCKHVMYHHMLVLHDMDETSVEKICCFFYTDGAILIQTARVCESFFSITLYVQQSSHAVFSQFITHRKKDSYSEGFTSEVIASV